MITKNAANVAINLAAEFDRRRLVLLPQPGTPLATLVAASCQSEVVVPSNDETFEPDAQYIEAMSAGYDGEGVSLHDQELQNWADFIGSKVREHLIFARTVVRPTITELAEQVTQDIASLPVSVQYERTLVRRSLPAPMTSLAFADMIAEFKDVNYEALRTYVGLEEKTGAEVIQMLVTGAADTDELIAAWAAEKGPTFFQTVWDAVFTASPSEDRFDTLIQDDLLGLDVAVVVFLLAKRLYNEPAEGTLMPLVEFNQKIADLRNQSALRIYHGYEAHQRNLSSKLLIVRLTQREITVNAEVYDEWMKNGGSNPVLFGAALSDRPVRFVADLDAKQVEFKDLWEQTNRFLTVAEQNNRFASYKQILRERAEKIIGDNLTAIFGGVVEEGQEVNKGLPAYVQAIELLNKFVDDVREPEFKDIWKVCTQLVCRSAFWFSNAEQILTGIDVACDENAGIEIREAALISVLQYIADYVCDQIRVTEV